MKVHPIYLKAARGEYVRGKDIAHLIRDALKREFAATKFSVTTKSTNSVNVRWFDGPPTEAVNRVAGAYETRGFDGSIDLAHSNSLWIYPDGSAHIAHDSGTEGSMGQHGEVIESPRRPDAILLDNVSSGFVFCSRSLHPFAYRRAIAEIRAKNYDCLAGVDWSLITVTVSDYDGSGVIKGAGHIRWDGRETWLDCAISQIAHTYDLTGDDGSEPVAMREYSQGWSAADFAPEAENPHPPGTLAASSWQAGREDAPAHQPVLCW